jgi:hypothetical protein
MFFQRELIRTPIRGESTVKVEHSGTSNTLTARRASDRIGSSIGPMEGCAFHGYPGTMPRGRNWQTAPDLGFRNHQFRNLSLRFTKQSIYEGKTQFFIIGVAFTTDE